MTSELIDAVVEWRNARAAFMRVQPIKPEDRFPEELWNQLASAEGKLYRLARQMDGLGWDSRYIG